MTRRRPGVDQEFAPSASRIATLPSEIVLLETCTAEVTPSEWSRLQVLLDGDPPTLKQKSLIKSIRRFEGCVEKKGLDATKVVRALAQIAGII